MKCKLVIISFWISDKLITIPYVVFDSIKMFTFHFIIFSTYTKLFRYYNICIEILTLKSNNIKKKQL